MADSGRLLFVVGSTTHWAVMRRVVQALPADVHADLYNLWEPQIFSARDHEPTIPRPYPGELNLAKFREIRRVMRSWTQQNHRGAIVIGTDVSQPYRALVAAIRQQTRKSDRDFTVAHIPVGILSERTLAWQTPWRKSAMDWLGRKVGVLAGADGVTFGTRPDIGLSWGAAWHPVYHARGVKKVIAVGNPVADELSTLAATTPHDVGASWPQRILVLSQPMYHSELAGTQANNRWYEWINRVITDAPETAKVRVRLHPYEKTMIASGELRLPAQVATAVTTNTNLPADIAWATAGVCATWSSTARLDAAAAGVPGVCIAVSETARAIAEQYVCNSDARVPWGYTTDPESGQPTSFPELHKLAIQARANQDPAYVNDYLTNIGTATRRAATVLSSLVEPRRPM